MSGDEGRGVFWIEIIWGDLPENTLHFQNKSRQQSPENLFFKFLPQGSRSGSLYTAQAYCILAPEIFKASRMYAKIFYFWINAENPSDFNQFSLVSPVYKEIFGEILKFPNKSWTSIAFIWYFRISIIRSKPILRGNEVTNMSRRNINYRELAKTYTYLDSEDYYCIENRAKGLTLAECFDYIGAIEEDIPAEELRTARRAHARGRVDAVHTAVDRLFQSMQGRQGGQNAMTYLRQMSGTFSAEVVADGSAKGFAFNVIIPDEKASTSAKSKTVAEVA